MWSARKIFLQVQRPILVGLTTSVVLYEDDCRVRTTIISRTSCSALSFLWGGETSPGGTRQKSTLRRQSTVELLQLTASSKTVDTVYNVKWQMPIGSGMFGDVYQGYHRDSKDKVAIKKISKKFTNNDAFQREMENLLKLERTGGHPSICLMREHFEDSDFFFLVLDLVEGGEVFDHLCQHGAYSEADASKLIRQIASALAFLHGIGMIHSDLKPENLMLSSSDGKKANVKIVDFGNAHQINNQTSDGHTEHRGTGLTPAYCPPEVLGPKKADPHAHCPIEPSYDMWSLGVILYVLLTGAHPFDLEGRASNEELEKLIVSGAPPPTRNCRYTRNLSKDAVEVVESLMHADPTQRPSAQELLRHPWVRGETASSTIISGSDRRLTEYHRHQTKVASSIFKHLLKNSDKHGGRHEAKKTNILELAFNDLDPGKRGYISTKELYGMTSVLASDAKLSLNELSHLLKENMAHRHYETGTVISREGEVGHCMYFVQSGTVSVESAENGFRTIRKPGDYFGIEALGKGQSKQKYAQTATALTPVHLLEIKREDFDKYMAHDLDIQMTVAETDRKGKRERAKVILGLQESLKQKKLREGQVLFKEGSPGNDLYILERGNVDITVDGRKVRTLRFGEMTGEHAAFYRQKPYNVTAQCMDPNGCLLRVLRGHHLRKMCEKDKDFEESFRDIILRRDFKKAVVKKTGRDFPETDDDLRKAFDMISNKKTGFVEFQTLKEAVEEWDKSYTEEDVRQMLSSLDLKGDGKLAWEDFQRIFSMFNDM